MLSKLWNARGVRPDPNEPGRDASLRGAPHVLEELGDGLWSPLTSPEGSRLDVAGGQLRKGAAAKQGRNLLEFLYLPVRDFLCHEQAGSQGWRPDVLQQCDHGWDRFQERFKEGKSFPILVINLHIAANSNGSEDGVSCQAVEGVDALNSLLPVLDALLFSSEGGSVLGENLLHHPSQFNDQGSPCLIVTRYELRKPESVVLIWETLLRLNDRGTWGEVELGWGRSGEGMGSSCPHFSSCSYRLLCTAHSSIGGEINGVG